MVHLVSYIGPHYCCWACPTAHGPETIGKFQVHGFRSSANEHSTNSIIDDTKLPRVPCVVPSDPFFYWCYSCLSLVFLSAARMKAVVIDFHGGSDLVSKPREEETSGADGEPLPVIRLQHLASSIARKSMTWGYGGDTAAMLL